MENCCPYIFSSSNLTDASRNLASSDLSKQHKILFKLVNLSKSDSKIECCENNTGFYLISWSYSGQRCITKRPALSFYFVKTVCSFLTRTGFVPLATDIFNGKSYGRTHRCKRTVFLRICDLILFTGARCQYRLQSVSWSAKTSFRLPRSNIVETDSCIRHRWVFMIL